MKIKFLTVLKDLKGEPIKDGSDPLTLGLACTAACINPIQDDVKETSPAQAVKLHALAVKIMTALNSDLGIADLTTDEIQLIKNRVHKIWPSPLVSGQVAQLLEGSDASSSK